MARFDVYIDDQGFILDPEYGDKAYVEMPQENFPGKDPTTFWQSWTQRSWHGGERQDVMLSSDDEQNFMYHDGEGLVMHEFGKATLQPVLSLDDSQSSSTMPMCSTTDGARVVVGLSSSPYIRRWYNGSWSSASSVAGSGAVTDIIADGDTLYAIRGGGVIKSTDNGDNWTNVQYTAQIVESITVSSIGSGYTSVPAVTIQAEAGEGSGATATAVLGYSGTCQSTGNTTTTTKLAASDTKPTNYYVNMTLEFTAGTGSGQSTTITAYDSTTKIATHEAITTPASGSTQYRIAGDSVTAVNVVSGGSGYTETPSVTFQSANGSGASAYATVGDGTPTSFSTATALAVVNEDLYVGKSSGGVWNNDESEDVVSTGTVTSMCGYKEDLFWINDRRLWRYNGKAAFVYDELPNSFIGTCLFSYRQVLFILGYYKEQTGKRGAIYYVIGGNENHLYSVGDYSADFTVSAAAGGDDEVWFANQGRGGGDRYDLTWGGLTCGPALGTAFTIPFKGMAYCDGYLFVARAGTGVYVCDVASPTAYETEGWFTSSEFDFNFANDEKILSSIGMYHRTLAEDESLTLHYSLDGGETWIEAGSSVDVGSRRRIFTFTTVRFDTIKLKVMMYGPGTSTPTLKKLLVKACAVSQAKWKWTLRILADKVASRSGRTRKGYEAVKKLKDVSDNQLPVSYVDRIGVTHTVIVEACEIDQQATSKRQAYLTALLREV